MTANLNNSVTPTAGPQCYRSFACYEIPFQPVDSLELEDTEHLRSFYVAYRDAAGRVVRFDKLRVLRAEKDPRAFTLPAASEPGATVYFEVVRDPATHEARLGKQIVYRETEHLDEFFAGNVDPSGETGQAALFRREVEFSDSYEYWPNGQLRKRVMSGSEALPAVAHFDREGRPLLEPVAADSES